MIATYNVVKILDAFNMVELEDGGYVQKGINGENVNAALNSLKPYDGKIENGEYDGKIENGELDTIIKAFLAKDVKIIATIKKTNFNGESIKEWDDFCIKVKRGEFETDEPKEVEPPKDTSKDQTKKAATESEYTVKIGEKDYTMDTIVELLKNPKTKFSVIFSICDKYDSSDEDFKTKCKEYKVTDILEEYNKLKGARNDLNEFKVWIKDNYENKEEMWGKACWGCFEVAYIQIQTDSPEICDRKQTQFIYDEEKEIKGQKITIKSDLVMEHIHSEIFSCKSLYDFMDYANKYVIELLNSKTNEDNKID